MANFLTQCPYCQTSFKVTDAHMQAANGVVRCGSCMEVFLAAQNKITPRQNKESTQSYNREKSPSDEPSTHTEKPDSPLASTPAPEQEDIPLFTIEPDVDEIYAKNNPESAETQFNAEDTAENHSGITEASALEEENTPFISWKTFDGAEDDATEPGDNKPTDSLPEQSTEETAVFFEEQIFSADDDRENLEQGDDESDETDNDHEAIAEQASPEYTEDSLENLENQVNQHVDQETSDDTNQKSPVGFNAFLDPAAYQVKVIDFSFDLTPEDNSGAIIASDESPHADTSDQNFAQEDALVQVHEDASKPDTTLAETAGKISRDEGEQAIEKLAASASSMGLTAAQVEGDLEESAIPILAPDFVASENIPVSLQQSAFAWSPVLKQAPLPEQGTTLVEKLPLQTDDEKAFIHNNLSTLRDSDSLLPLPPENLEAINEEPVELASFYDPLKKTKTIALSLLSVLLIFTLAGQFAWYNLESLIEDERFDPATARLCNLIECPDTSAIDLSALITEELMIRSHPALADALLVNFIFRNDAAREQPFPLVELNFTNNNGTIVANRVFTPLEYLPEEMHLFTHMPAHSSIQVSLELVDPGDDATGYSLVFRNP
jgi:predicted Zn finger-like uncharacterized protein